MRAGLSYYISRCRCLGCATLLAVTACTFDMAQITQENFQQGDRPAVAASLTFLSDYRSTLQYLPKADRWDEKVIGTLSLEARRDDGAPGHMLEIRRIRKGYALENMLHENDAGQRLMFSASYSREHDAMAGLCFRWSF